MPEPSETAIQPNRDRRVFRWYLVCLVVPAVGILLALAAGVPPPLLRSAVEFQAVTLAAAVYFIVASRMQRRTARTQRRLETLSGMRFTTPVWMTLMVCSIPIEIGATLAAITATLGFAGVGNGIFLTFALIALGLPLGKVGLQPRWIVFEQSGVRLSVSRATFLIPWSAIARVETMGPDHFVALTLVLVDSEAVLQSVQPDDPKARDRVRNLVQSSHHGRTEVFLMPWASGLDGQTLARGIREGMRGSTPGMN